MRKLLFILAMLAAVSVGAFADRVVTYTLVSAARQDVTEISLTLVNDVPMARVIYQVRDNGGAVRESRKSIDIPLATPQINQLNGFINGTVIPAINTAEGL